MTKPQPPEGYGTVTPWVVTKDTRRLLQFIKEAFDAEELGRVEVEGGAIGHAEARIGDSIIMMFDSPFPVATPGLLRLYVEDGDAMFRRAEAAGATPVTRLTELAWGDRVGRVRDPLGNIWWIQERVEEPTLTRWPGASKIRGSPRACSTSNRPSHLAWTRPEQDRWISTDRISIVGDLLDGGRGDCRRETADLLPPFCLDGRTCHD
jgi:PhnB protein